MVGGRFSARPTTLRHSPHALLNTFQLPDRQYLILSQHTCPMLITSHDTHTASSRYANTAVVSSTSLFPPDNPDAANLVILELT